MWQADLTRRLPIAAISSLTLRRSGSSVAAIVAGENRGSRLRAVVALLMLVALGLVAAAPTAATGFTAARSSTTTFQPGDLFTVSGPHFNLIDWRHSDG